MDTFVGVLIGVGLAAACGFRVFLPFLVMSVAAAAGHLPLAGGFEWIGTTPALIAFAVATVVEVLAFYVPWVDNALDVVAQPMAMLAGVIVTAAVVTDLDPLWKWSFAIIAGGGVAGTLQGGTVAARGISTLTTAGLGNFLVSTLEVAGAVITSLLAVLLPVVGAVLAVGLVVTALRLLRRWRRRRATVPYSSG